MRFGVFASILTVPLLLSSFVGAAEPATARPGWFGVFPAMEHYQRTYFKPAIHKTAKDAYSQTVRYDWMGNDFRVFNVTLSRDPALMKQYSAEAVKRHDPAPTAVKVGKRTAWRYELIPPGESSIERPNSRLVLPLADDRVLIVEATGSPRAEEFPELSRADLDRLTSALDAPPLNDAKLTLERFRAVPKGATYPEIVAWAGEPVKDVGSGIHIMVFPLDDGGDVRIGTSDLKSVRYIKHLAKDGTVTDLAK